MKQKKIREEKADKIRNEGLKVQRSEEEEKNQEIDLEIEDPGASSKVAEEGSKVMSKQEYDSLSKQLEDARKKPGNRIGKGGVKIPLKSPTEFADTMRILVLHDTKTDEK